MKLSRALLLATCLCQQSSMAVSVVAAGHTIHQSEEAALLSTSTTILDNRVLKEGGGNIMDNNNNNANRNEQDSAGDSAPNSAAASSSPPPPATPKAVSPDDPIQDKDNHQPILFNRKQLVLFAGPHKSGSTSVEEFMAEWAQDGWQKGHPHTKRCVSLFVVCVCVCILFLFFLLPLPTGIGLPGSFF